MYLNRNNFEKINKVISNFPEAKTFELNQDNSSGIGSHTTLHIHTSINGIEGKFEVVISSVEDW